MMVKEVTSLDQRIATVVEGIEYYSLLILSDQRAVESASEDGLVYAKATLTVDTQRRQRLWEELDRLQIERDAALKLPPREDVV